MRWLTVALALTLSEVPVAAQDAVTSLPANYKVTFDNEYVRVTRVYYPANAKLPGHTHTSLPSAYVYLNDSGPVVFRHIGLDYGAVTRPPTVARSFRVFRGLEEIHEVENLAGVPSEFLRVEFKTDPGPDIRTLRGKFLPPDPVADVVQKVEFENAQLRVTRVIVPIGKSATLAASPHPAAVISLTAGELGNATWLEQGRQFSVDAASRGAELLRFEMKTPVKRSR